MSEHVWEDLVERLLVEKRDMFTRRNHRIRDDADWRAQIDVVALDFPQRTIWLVEVSVGRGAGIIHKAQNFAEYRDRVLSWLRGQSHEAGALFEHWTVSMMTFVRADVDSQISKYLDQIPGARGENLEEVALEMLGMEKTVAAEMLNRQGSRQT